MTVQIVTQAVFKKVAAPLDLIPLINSEHRAASMLKALCRHHPDAVDADSLMNYGGLREGHQRAAFHWWMMRINDRLPRTGWRVEDVGRNGVRLARITPEHQRMLEERLNREAAA